MRKISVALDEDVAAAARSAADAAGQSLSAWLTDAARTRLRLADGLAAMADWDAEVGPVPDEEQRAAAAWADRILGATEPDDDAA